MGIVGSGHFEGQIPGWMPLRLSWQRHQSI